jgi:DNA helicase-2/ATP-dependent DNA helicase PcrA
MDADQFTTLYNQLNEAQQNAVDTIEGPVLVIAGPGTGKTQLLSMRVANILKQTDTAPQNILCLTFTESAAHNMRKRLRSIIGLEADKVIVNTFHGIGTEIINANPDYFYKGADFQPADDLSKLEIIQNILTKLDDDDPLKSYHPQEGWIFAKDIISRIGDLKKGGLTPLEYHGILQTNRVFIETIDPIFTDMFSQNMRSITLDKVLEFEQKCSHAIQEVMSKTRVLRDEDDTNIDLNGQHTIFDHWGEVFLDSLRQAIDESQAEGKFKTGAITTWKDAWKKKDYTGANRLKDCMDMKKHFSTARIYQQYQTELYNASLFDFDDMLLDVIEALRKNPELRYTYQEKFQYILVDEFQDTNGAQMSLVQNFINLELTNNRPNILVVGDDDQSIFKFQGANIHNIISFKEVYDDVTIITLNNNYRSSQDILDLAHEIINVSNERLAYHAGVDKQLISKM